MSEKSSGKDSTPNLGKIQVESTRGFKGGGWVLGGGGVWWFWWVNKYTYRKKHCGESKKVFATTKILRNARAQRGKKIGKGKKGKGGTLLWSMGRESKSPTNTNTSLKKNRSHYMKGSHTKETTWQIRRLWYGDVEDLFLGTFQNGDYGGVIKDIWDNPKRGFGIGHKRRGHGEVYKKPN